MEYTMGGAVIVVVLAFLKYLKANRKSCERCRSEHHEVITNHMTHSTEAINTLSETLERFINKLDGK